MMKMQILKNEAANVNQQTYIVTENNKNAFRGIASPGSSKNFNVPDEVSREIQREISEANFMFAYQNQEFMMQPTEVTMDNQ